MVERELYSQEAEHGVLGALMIKPDLCEEIGAFLGPQDFAYEDNSTLYSMILGCHSKRISPDPVTLMDIRQDLPSGEMTIIYAADIMRNVPSAANAIPYARIVLERSTARKLQALAMQISEIAQSKGKIADQVAQAQSLIMGLNVGEETPDFISIADGLDQVLERIERRRSGTEELGLDFGLEDLDKIIRGIRRQNLVIIAGRPSTGKTVLGMGLAERASLFHGMKSLVFSLEMSGADLSQRSLASVSGVKLERIESGDSMDDGEESAKIMAAAFKMKNANLHICEKPALLFSRLCNMARFQHRAGKLDLIVIDYIGLIVGDPSKSIQNRNQELGAISRGLKALAKELNVPVVALAQLNRGIEGRTDPKPKMSDLRDSGEIEQDADVIIMAHRDMQSERGKNGITEVEAVKVRHAKPGFCILQFQGDKARFVNAVQGDYDEREEERAAKPKNPKDFKKKQMEPNF
jgi:replicative DNA helicase